jgi:hypothetical protein
MERPKCVILIILFLLHNDDERGHQITNASFSYGRDIEVRNDALHFIRVWDAWLMKSKLAFPRVANEHE